MSKAVNLMHLHVFYATQMRKWIRKKFVLTYLELKYQIIFCIFLEHILSVFSAFMHAYLIFLNSENAQPWL